MATQIPFNPALFTPQLWNAFANPASMLQTLFNYAAAASAAVPNQPLGPALPLMDNNVVNNTPQQPQKMNSSSGSSNLSKTNSSSSSHSRSISRRHSRSPRRYR